MKTSLYTVRSSDVGFERALEGGKYVIDEQLNKEMYIVFFYVLKGAWIMRKLMQSYTGRSN